MPNLKDISGYRLLMFVMIFVFFTKNAYAYLDAGSGSYIIQMLIGALMGSIITIKIYWKNISNLFKKNLKHRK